MHQLDRRIYDLIRERGFSQLSEVQKQAIPRIVHGEHLLLIAPTGTGKTESAMIPVFNGMLTAQGTGFTTLYITPLRALNRDILRRMEWWSQNLGLLSGVRHGDTPPAERRKQVLHPPDLLITTPETVQALFMGKRLKEHLRSVKYVIIDEIHDLAGTKRGAQLVIALERLTRYAGEFQRIGLSATVGNPREIAAFLTGERPCAIVEVPVAKRLDIGVEITGERFESQVNAIRQYTKKGDSTLIFVNTRSTAELLAHALHADGSVDVHHGSLSREIRIEAEDRFKRGEIATLICTSSMELGIDIGHVEHVIQFGSPREVSRLVQRIGRAGHQIGKISQGTIISSGFDDVCESLVIAHRARKGIVEKVVPSYEAGDVVGNQIAAIAVEYGEISIDDIFSIISKSSVGIKEYEAFLAIIDQLAEHYLIRRQGNLIITTSRARRYLAGNLSMIPEERKFPIYDMVTRRTVGALDESFIITSLHTGAVFIARGQLWRVLDLEDGRVMVEPARNAEGELPSWEGEQIPVPFEIAREVGSLRRTRNFSAYTDDTALIAFAHGFLDLVLKNHGLVPTDQTIILEYSDEGICVNICAGHQTNEAIGRMLSILLSARFGSTIGLELDAYRILLRVPREISCTHVQEILTSVKPDHVKGILELALKNTSLFRWKLVQISKKFGAIDPDADYERISLHRLAELLAHPPIQRETFRELFSRYMDLEHATEILREIQAGKIQILIGPPSMLGAAALFSSSRDQIPPPTADQAVIAALRHRLMQQGVILVCMNCRAWKSKTVMARIPEQPVCGHCGARLIAALKPYEAELYAIANKKIKNTEEKAIEQKLMRNANMVLSSGKKAILILSAKGVGPETASRILATHTTGDALLREILKAERNFVKTHRFWQ